MISELSDILLIYSSKILVNFYRYKLMVALLLTKVTLKCITYPDSNATLESIVPELLYIPIVSGRFTFRYRSNAFFFTISLDQFIFFSFFSFIFFSLHFFLFFSIHASTLHPHTADVGIEEAKKVKKHQEKERGMFEKSQ